MRLLVVSDEESTYIWDHFDKDRFKGIDLIVSCGDLKQQYLSFLVSMIPAPLFYVHGNHDIDYTINPPDGCECIDGKLKSYKGIRIMGLGGSYKYSPGEFQYSEKEMKRRILKLKPKLWLKKGIDILVTHAPAYKIGDGKDKVHRGFECFVTLLDKYQPKYLFHGHQHLNYGRNERIHHYKNTTIVNGFGYCIVDY